MPEYSITPKALKNISLIEYSKAIFENTTILTQWEEKIKKDALVSIVGDSLRIGKKFLDEYKIKQILDGLTTNNVPEIINILNAFQYINEISESEEFEEIDFKYLNKELGKNIYPQTKLGSYRTAKVKDKADPQEILAQVVQIFDWLNGLDAKDTHPIIKASVFKSKMESLIPLEVMNSETINFATRKILKTDGYDFGNLLNLEGYFLERPQNYQSEIDVLSEEDEDFTSFIEYFSEGFALNASRISENMKLLAKDTKVAKATGRVKVSKRQERIVEYLQDYGTLQNKDFPTVFPDISEDTVLRNLRTLIDMGLIVKMGSTKSSRYELK